ncbi:MAG: bifunctional phosphopantothenoylcysteine decarboxylase/phosphopantothenate--cysteine ligase CoaBC, partial [Nitrosopumilaceae archaeon]
IPIVMALAMHEAMYDNAAVRKNMDFLKGKVDFVSPQMIEGKAKAAEPEEVLDFVLKKFGASSKLCGKRVLITAGPTIEYIDPVRVITNQSTGKTGVLLASEFVSAGAKVTLIYGPGKELPPKGVKLIRVETSQEMLDAVKKVMKQKFDIVILAAAVSDYIPEKPSVMKIKSDQNKILLKLKRASKIIDQIKKIQKNIFLVGFKAETNLPKEKLIIEARKRLRETGADLMIANDIGTKYKKNSDYNNVILVNSKKVIQSGWKKKFEIARFIRKEIENRLNT